MPFKIVKSSRDPKSPPYIGPACQAAGVEPGRVYETREQAEADATKVSKANPVGFSVHPTDAPDPAEDRPGPYCRWPLIPR